MFAVLKTGGKQYKVSSGDVLRVELLDAAAGDKLQFNDILMLGGDQMTVGSPMIAGAAVQAEVIDNIKADKVIHYVKRRRKHSSQRTKGHRQKLTLVRVTEILASGGDVSGVRAAIGTSAARIAAHNTAPASDTPAAKPAAKAATKPAAKAATKPAAKATTRLAAKAAAKPAAKAAKTTVKAVAKPAGTADTAPTEAAKPKRAAKKAVADAKE